MGFSPVNFDHLARFNSAVSSDFLDNYESFVDRSLVEASKSKPHQTFAPSAFRCDRRSWFRLRGVDPDAVKVPDRVLDFSAQIGTACHRMIQSNLKESLKDDWINVSNYLRGEFCEVPSYTYLLSKDDSGLETLVEVIDPPIRFACDGIIRIDGKFYLLEIKSSEYSSWNDLTDPKPQHIDQVQCYCTLLGLSDVLFVYIDRQYGGLKCYEYKVTDYTKVAVEERFKYVMKMVESNLAPEGLPIGDSWCNSSMCPYYKKCQEYGR